MIIPRTLKLGPVNDHGTLKLSPVIIHGTQEWSLYVEFPATDEGLVQVGGVKNMLIQFNGCLTTFMNPLIEQKTKFPFFFFFYF